MSKTPEQLAEEYADNWHKDCDYPDEILRLTKKATATAFLAGYQAAKDEEATKDQKIAELWTESIKKMLPSVHEITLFPSKPSNDEVVAKMDAAIGKAKGNFSNNSNGWISVKDRLPEFTEGWCIVYGANTGRRWMVQPAYYDAHKEEWMSRFIKHRSEIAVDGKLTEWIEYLPLEDVTHWMPLPKPPEDK